MWIRGVQLIVYQKDNPDKRSIFSQHRIDIEIRSTVGWPADTANISIFNLSLDEVKFLQSKTYGELYIEIRAGYMDQMSNSSVSQITLSQGQQALPVQIGGELQLPTIFSGVITNAVGFRRPPEHVTQLFCISHAYGSSTDFKQMRAVPPGSTLQDAIKSMCSDYGFGTVATFGVGAETLNRVLPRGRVFHNTFLVEFRKLLGEFNLLYTMTTGEIQVFPDTYGNKDAVDRMSKDRAPIQLDPNQVIGNPIAGICTYSLDTFLNPAIQPGMILDVSPLLGSNGILANGVTSVSGQGIVLNTDQSIFRWAMEDKYFIMDVVHHGSTHTMDFKTSIGAILGGNTAMGMKELSWQTMYANSGMAMESY